MQRLTKSSADMILSLLGFGASAIAKTEKRDVDSLNNQVLGDMFYELSALPSVIKLIQKAWDWRFEKSFTASDDTIKITKIKKVFSEIHRVSESIANRKKPVIKEQYGIYAKGIVNDLEKLLASISLLTKLQISETDNAIVILAKKYAQDLLVFLSNAFITVEHKDNLGKVFVQNIESELSFKQQKRLADLRDNILNFYEILQSQVKILEPNHQDIVRSELVDTLYCIRAQEHYAGHLFPKHRNSILPVVHQHPVEHHIESAQQSQARWNAFKHKDVQEKAVDINVAMKNLQEGSVYMLLSMIEAPHRYPLRGEAEVLLKEKDELLKSLLFYEMTGDFCIVLQAGKEHELTQSFAWNNATLTQYFLESYSEKNAEKASEMSAWIQAQFPEFFSISSDNMARAQKTQKDALAADEDSRSEISDVTTQDFISDTEAMHLDKLAFENTSEKSSKSTETNNTANTQPLSQTSTPPSSARSMLFSPKARVVPAPVSDDLDVFVSFRHSSKPINA